MSKQNLIFYSNSCDYCRDLAKLMAEVGVLNNFKRFCTDDPNIKIPSIIKTVLGFIFLLDKIGMPIFPASMTSFF